MNLSNKKVIGFDLDGVILDHSQQKQKLAKRFGYEVELTETPSSIFYKRIEDKDKYREIRSILYDDPIEAFLSPLMSGALDGLKMVKDSGTPFYLISRRKKEDRAIELLKDKNLWPSLFNEENTFFVLEPIDKEIKAKELSITHYIDDEAQILSLLNSVKNKYLFDQFGVYDDSQYDLVKNWGDILRVLNV